MVTVFNLPLSHNRAKLLALVLESEGIACRLTRPDGGWVLEVHGSDLEKARACIEAYDAENPVQPEKSKTAAPIFPHALTGLTAAGVLAAVHVAVNMHADGHLYLETFGASARSITSGAYYRSVTALLLHGDSAHLVANMTAMAIFGTAVCRVTGWGLGWLLILCSGAAGNMANAFLYGSRHLSIGASTAVFGAVGILCGHAFLSRYCRPGGRLKAWLPLGAGLAIVAFLGAGPHTDITAHLFGFLAGIPVGLAYPLYTGWANRTGVQAAAMAATLLLISGSWMMAL